MAVWFQVGGFALVVVGVGCWSVPLAMIVAGITMFIAGGLEQRGGRQ